jgi:hypothetical protein
MYISKYCISEYMCGMFISRNVLHSDAYVPSARDHLWVHADVAQNAAGPQQDCQRPGLAVTATRGFDPVTRQ